MLQKNKHIRNLIASLCFFMLFSLVYVGGKYIFSSTTIPSDYAGPSEYLFNLKIPKDLHFAGEKIPQDDYSIKENMERVMAGGNFERSTAYILFSRAAQWFPIIEKILKRNGIPDDFKYVALAESRLTNSTSPQGAVGFWQFIESTARNYGLEINSEVDERYSVEKSTEAACKFLKEAYRKFGNWTLCAAAYNMGMGGVEYHLKKQPSKSYYDLLMNKETSFYIYRILALKTVFLNSGKKFHGAGKNIYAVPSIVFKIDTGIRDLSEFAIRMHYNYEILKTFNPWITGNTLFNPEKRTYLIRFPKKEPLKPSDGNSKASDHTSDSTHVWHAIGADTTYLKADSLTKNTTIQLKDTGKNEHERK